VPSWLIDPSLDFGDVHKPPSYLIASLQQAFDDYASEHDPPTYEHSVTVGTSSGSPSRRVSLMGESIWEADDDEEQCADGCSADADDEDDGTDEDIECESECGKGKGVPDSDSQSTLYRIPLQEFPSVPSPSTSTTAPQVTDDSQPKHQRQRPRPLPPLPHIPPPAYHLLHLQHLMNTSDADPYSELAQCLSSLDPQLLLQPFAVFVDLCYEDSVRGDKSASPLRPFSPQTPPPMSHSSSLTDESEDEDEELLRSPTQAANSATSPAETAVGPLVYDPKMDERIRGVNDLRMPLHISRTMSPTLGPHEDSILSPVSQTPKQPLQSQHVRFVSGHQSSNVSVSDMFI
jgi:hypothetical protein